VLFNSFEFIFLFFPVVAVCAIFVCRGNTRYWVLIFASLLFYAQSGREHAYVLIISVIWIYAFIDRKFLSLTPNLNLFAATIGPVSALIYYKYSKFIFYDVLRLGKAAESTAFSLFDDIILPAGISFFTFQLLAYAFDRHTKKIAEPIGFRNLILYISFFPQLIAGPIVRYEQVATAIIGLRTFVLTEGYLVNAILYFTFGLAYKVLLADTIGIFIEPLIAAPKDLGLSGLLVVIFSYTFQIYFDFYGYSLCAIGLASLFGFRLPDNFKRPYSTLNPRTFWQCWHVTLSYWIRDYLYIPLGGNTAYTRNIIIVFLVCGLWHGAGFSFIIWGLYHALLVAGYSSISESWNRLPLIFQWALNFTAVSVGWLFFVFTLDDLWIAMMSVTVTPWLDHQFDLNVALIVFIAAIVCFFMRIEKVADYLSKQNSHWAVALLSGVLSAVVLIISIVYLDRSASFIYFRF